MIIATCRRAAESTVTIAFYFSIHSFNLSFTLCRRFYSEVIISLLAFDTTEYLKLPGLGKLSVTYLTSRMAEHRGFSLQ
jgi:hypothetical protein